MIGCLTLLCLVAIANAQFALPGKCPSVTPMKDFDIEKVLGLWYTAEVKHKQYSCKTDTITLDDDQTVLFKLTKYDTDQDAYYCTTIKALHDKSNRIAVYGETLNTRSADTFYYTLGTDYTSYHVIYACVQQPDSYRLFLYIDTREEKPSEETLEKAHEVLKANNLSYELLKVNHENCPQARSACVEFIPEDLNAEIAKA